MASVNKVFVLGNLGKDVELRYMQSGDAIANLTVATSETWKDKQGEKKEKTEWHRVTMFGKLAEIAGEYLSKGSSVYIEGKMQTRKYTDKDGNDRYTTEIIANEMKMLGGKPDAARPSAPKPSKTAREPGSDDDFGSDEIPF